MEVIKPILFYFPTTVLFVDDDPVFLANIGFEIDDKTPLMSCDKSRHVTDLLSQRSSFHTLVKKMVSHVDFEDVDAPFGRAVRANIDCLYNEVFNPNRFEYISTLVVDYSMPGLNGAELCGLLKDNPVKKIMLTGAADYNIAVDLFNSGLIDSFIIKDSPLMTDQLNLSIHTAQRSYFKEAALPLIHAIPNEGSPLRISVFWEFINNYIAQNSFSEYYLIDGSGSFLFIDFFGNPVWMIVKSDREINGYFNIAVDSEASDDLVYSLDKRLKLPFFLTENDQKIPVSKWADYFHAAKNFPGLDGYYFAILENYSHASFDGSVIFSHKDFMDKKCEIDSSA